LALTDDGDVWWEGMNGTHRQACQRTSSTGRGQDWTPQIAKETGAKPHIRSRFALPP
jgi:phosphoenolpyruvate carboxykinase (GTP)